MERERAKAIKAAIRANFDASPASYDDFEGATGLFSFLARELAREAGLAPGMSVVDAGCGTGVSTEVIAGLVGPGGRVLGIDLSPGMIEAARAKLASAGNVRLVAGDVEELEALLASGPGPINQWDAVLYTACVFLLPDAGRALRGARAALKPGGVVGANFIEGSYIDGRELFRELLPEWAGGERFPLPRFPCDTSALPALLEGHGFRDMRRGTVEWPMSLDGLRRFYQVPAQSASLYPRAGYEERRAAVGRIFALAEARGVKGSSMRWSWLVAGR
ncbi:MAG: class I SAM-dependent methyltransferase [Thermoplasmatota archaeon]